MSLSGGLLFFDTHEITRFSVYNAFNCSKAQQGSYVCISECINDGQHYAPVKCTKAAGCQTLEIRCGYSCISADLHLLL